MAAHRVTGLAATSPIKAVKAAESLLANGDIIGGPVLYSTRPVQWDESPSVLLTSRLATLRRALAGPAPPYRSVLLAGWLEMRGAGIPVSDAMPSEDDPMMCVPLRLTRADVADAILRCPKVSGIEPPDLAGAMFSDVDGSLTQTLLKLMESADSGGAKSRIKAAYVSWLTDGAPVSDAARSLADAGASDEAVSDAAAWLESEKGSEARGIMLKVARALSRGSEVDYVGIVEGTQVAPFDLRYLATAAGLRSN